jgi:hypothetical protein
MKTVRLITFFIVAILVCSAWTPSPVLASTEVARETIEANGVSANVDVAAPKLVKVTITNKTGGTMYISLVGPRNYSFAAPNQGKTSFQIVPGRYTYTLRTSACPGSVTKKAYFKTGGSLGAWMCPK